MFGDDGFDRIVGGSGDDTINGGSGNDTLGGWLFTTVSEDETGSDQIFGGEGDDRLLLTSNSSASLLDGGIGDDYLYADGRFDSVSTLVGGQGSDTFALEWGAANFIVLKDFSVEEGDRLALKDASWRYEPRQLAGTAAQSFVGYEGIFEGGQLLAITPGIGSAQAAINSAFSG